MTFSEPGIHRLTFADDFWPAADELRRELLESPAWMAMTQGHAGVVQLRTDRQNGITIPHIGSDDRFPATQAFRDFLDGRSHELCARLGVAVPSGEAIEIEMNAMAYGEGCWLSPHTDFQPTANGRRLVAWMLYLTHPDDGEWESGYGGAVRLVDAEKRETRLAPRFNRFAMFEVSPGSLHEIERVQWACGWNRCRLALSGWFRGRDTERRQARLYVRRAARPSGSAEAATALGAAALADLLRAQARFSGREMIEVDAELDEARDAAEYDASAIAPEGTVFSGYVPGPAWCIFVVDEDGKLLFFGPREEYQPG